METGNKLRRVTVLIQVWKHSNLSLTDFVIILKGIMDKVCHIHHFSFLLSGIRYSINVEGIVDVL